MAGKTGVIFIDGSQFPIVDQSVEANTINNLGSGVTVATGQDLFGVPSLEFNGTAYLNATDNAAFSLGDIGGGNDWTIDFWYKHTAFTGNYQGYLSCYGDGYVTTTSMDGGTMGGLYSGNTPGTYLFNGAGLTNVVGQWYHIAYVKSGTTVSMYRDGVLITTGNDASMNTSYALAIGASRPDANLSRFFKGYMNFFRISKEALWTSNFNLTESELFYGSTIKIPASSIYGGSYRGNIRGKAAEGFIRPTLKQFFTSYPDFEEIPSIDARFDSEAKATDIALSNEDLVATNVANYDYGWVSVSVTPDLPLNSKTYVEFEVIAKYADNLMLGLIFSADTFDYNNNTSYLNTQFNKSVVLSGNGYNYYPSSGVVTTQFNTGDIIGITFDMTSKSVSFYYNNSHKYTANIGLALGTCRYGAFLARYTNIHPTVKFLKPDQHNYTAPAGFDAFG